jgi:hypothetical protein
VADRLRLLPPKFLPIVYFTAARVAVMVALLAVALDPTVAAGYFYHPRLIAIVHLVTIGWLTFSIYGSLYIVGPFAMRIALPTSWPDYVVCVAAVVGLVAAVGRFWQNDIATGGWWAALVLPAAVWLAIRILSALRASPVQRGVTAHLALAFLNFFAAAALGVTLGIDRARNLLPAPTLSNLSAHAHLAAVGWVGLMAVGVGYRLFPMVLPAAMPSGRSLYVSVVLIQAGVLASAAGWLLQRGWLVPAGAACIGGGFLAFLLHVRWMLARQKPRPPALPSPDFGALQALCALVCLALAIAMGVYLAVAPMTPLTVRLTLAYGIVGLIGFFAQLVAGMEYRLLPYFAWYWAFANTRFKGPVPSPHEMPIPGVQRAAFFLWLAGVPLLAVGAAWPLPRLVSAGAWLILLAIAAGGIDAAAIVSHAFRRGRMDDGHAGGEAIPGEPRRGQL